MRASSDIMDYGNADGEMAYASGSTGSSPPPGKSNNAAVNNQQGPAMSVRRTSSK